MGQGVAVGGNIFVDRLKRVPFYPAKGMLLPIQSEEMSVGGCVSNTAIDGGSAGAGGALSAKAGVNISLNTRNYGLLDMVSGLLPLPKQRITKKESRKGKIYDDAAGSNGAGYPPKNHYSGF